VLSHVKTDGVGSVYSMWKHKNTVNVFFCKVVSHVNLTGSWITLLLEAKFQSLCLFKQKSKVKSKML